MLRPETLAVTTTFFSFFWSCKYGNLGRIKTHIRLLYCTPVHVRWEPEQHAAESIAKSSGPRNGPGALPSGLFPSRLPDGATGTTLMMTFPFYILLLSILYPAPPLYLLIG